MIKTGDVIRISMHNKTRSTRLLKVISFHRTYNETGYVSFLGRRARFNSDDTLSTYGADHAYLVKIDDVEVLSA